MSDHQSKKIYDPNFSGDSPSPAPLLLANEAPPWRRFSARQNVEKQEVPSPRKMDEDQANTGRRYLSSATEAKLIDAALVLRRPLLVTGQAGFGKTSLAYSVAWQLGLGNVLRWGVTSRSTLKESLYHYDAIARLHDASLNEKGLADSSLSFGDYITLGPLGTALLPTESSTYFPRVLLIDEIDKSDADLPSDLLHVLEEGAFTIPEIGRLPNSHKKDSINVNTVDSILPKVSVPSNGRIRCSDFPLIIMTSNGDRDFPPAFLRRCLQLTITRPTKAKLESIITAHLGLEARQDPDVAKLLERFDSERDDQQALLAVDQLLNAIYLARSDAAVSPLDHEEILTSVFRSLSDSASSPA